MEIRVCGQSGVSPLARGSPKTTQAGQPIRYTPASLSSRVYPHLRGAARRLSGCVYGQGGVSPLARGSHIQPRRILVYRRCIPTCAGQPDRIGFDKDFIKVYPHLRGAATSSIFPGLFGTGVSPLARGSRELYRSVLFFLGCIPTCAGQPSRTASSCRRITVYPHLRGAARLSVLFAQCVKGVSPLARGSPSHFFLGSRPGRCIPTCAGQPEEAVRERLLKKVYPHLRGAAYPILKQQLYQRGVSPLARGSPSPMRKVNCWRRCIPTCAGQPARAALGSAPMRVYPHLRGAATKVVFPVFALAGVSPLARGSRYATRQRVCRAGCIPTCAGQPVTAGIRSPSALVYPHLRGAAVHGVPGGPERGGVSPLARGSPSYECRARLSVRCIPTCAGQPGLRVWYSSLTRVYPHLRGAA